MDKSVPPNRVIPSGSGRGWHFSAIRLLSRFVTVRRGAVSAAAVLFFVGGASLGCSGADKGVALPSISRGTPTPSAPAFPKTREGAAAFAHLYFDVSNAATASGQTEALSSLALSSCQTCKRYRAYVQRAYAAGGRIEGGDLVVVSSVAPPFTDDMVTVTVVGDQRSGELVDTQGRVSSRIQAVRRGDLEVTIRRIGERWLVGEIVMFNSGR